MTQAHGCKEQRCGVTIPARRAPPRNRDQPKDWWGTVPNTCTEGHVVGASSVDSVYEGLEISSWSLTITCSRSDVTVVLLAVGFEFVFVPVVYKIRVGFASAFHCFLCAVSEHLDDSGVVCD